MDFFLNLAFLIVVSITGSYGQGFGPFRPFGFPGFGRPPFPFGPPPPGLGPMPPMPMPAFPGPPLPPLPPPDAGIAAGETGFPGPLSPFPEMGSPDSIPSTSFDALPDTEVQGGSPFGSSVDPFAATGTTLPDGAIQDTTFFENQGSTSLEGTLQIPGTGATATGEFPSITMPGDSTTSFPELTLPGGTTGALPGLTSATGTTTSDAGVPAGLNPATAAEPSFATRFGTGVNGNSAAQGQQSVFTQGTSRVTTNTATDNILAQLMPNTGPQQTVLQRNGGSNAFDSARILNTVFGSGASASNNQDTRGNGNPFTTAQNVQTQTLPTGNDGPGLMPRTTLIQSETFDNSVLRQENPFLGQTSVMPNTNQLGISANQIQTRNTPETNFGTGLLAGSQFSGTGPQLPTGSQSSSVTSQRFGGTESMTSSPAMTNGQLSNSQFNSMSGNSLTGQFPAGPSIAFGNQLTTGSNVNSQISSSPSESRFSFGASTSQSRFSSNNGGTQTQNINSLSTNMGNQVTVGGNLPQSSQNRFEQADVSSNVISPQNDFIFTRQAVQPNVLVQSNAQTNPRVVGSATNGFAQFIGSAQRGTGNENSIFSSTNQQSGGSVSQQAAPSIFPNTGFGQANSISTSMTSVGTVGSDQRFGMSFPTQTFAGGISNQTQVKVIETGQNKIVLSNQLPIQNGNQTFTVMENNTACQLRGCSGGEQCVFMDFYPCPNWITTLQCRCLPGCVINNRFIPRGQTITVDTCGNQCSCVNNDGKASCSTKECPASAA